MDIVIRGRHARGFSLLELMIALVIAGVATIGLMTLLHERADAEVRALAAQQMVTYAAAVDQYVSANTASLTASTGPTTPATITTAQLQAAGFLPPSFAPLNPYGQSYITQVIQPTAGKLSPLIVTTGGTLIGDGALRDLATKITAFGAAGGYIGSQTPTIATGAGGWWSQSLAAYGIAPGAGHIADGLFVSLQSTIDDYLHRDYNGNPALNAMSTAINMQGNNITNAGTVTASLLNLPGGVNSIDMGGSYLYGDASNLALRAATGNVYIQSLSGAAGSIPEVHNISGDSGSTFTAQYLSAATGVWGGSYVNSNGTIDAAGNITAGGSVSANNGFDSFGATGWYNQTYGGGWYMSDPTWIRAYANKNVYTGGQIQGGTIVSQGRMTANEYLQINGTAAVGGGCSPNGLLGVQPGTGALLNCKSGVWVQAMGLSTVIETGAGFVGTTYYNPQNFSSVTCPAGYIATGAGWLTTVYSGGAAAPDEIRPYNATTWYFHAGANSTGDWFEPYVVCVGS